MRCITKKELHALLHLQGASFTQNEKIDFQTTGNDQVMVSMPEKTANLNYFSSFLVDWLPKKHDHYLYLSYWGTEPVHQMVFFEKIRGAYGEYRQLIDAPAQLFNISDNEDYSMMTEMVFLVMAFDWNAYTFTKGSNDHIFISDEHVWFSSDNPSKIDQAVETAKAMKLRRIERMTHKPS